MTAITSVDHKQEDVKTAYKPKLKVILLGQSGAGKSSLLDSFSGRPFNTSIISTIGIDFISNKTSYLGKDYSVQIWDTSGQERFGSITQTYFRDALVAIIVFDVCCLDSYKKAIIWLQQRCALYDKKIWSDVTILVGTKCDLENKRVIPKEDANELARQYGIQYFDASAFNGDGVQIIFSTAITMAISRSRSDSGNKTERVPHVKQKEIIPLETLQIVQTLPEKQKCNCVIL
jgi:small GTP-binding protein